MPSVQNFYLRNQVRFPLRHMEKMIYDQEKKTRVFQSQVGCMTHPMLEKHMKNIEQVIKMFSSPFQDKTMKSIKYQLQKNMYRFYH